MNRFEQMEETHSAYLPLYTDVVRQAAAPKGARKVLEDFVIGQLGAKKGVRGYLVRKMYELAVDSDWQQALPVIAATELSLSSMYCFNIAADQKSGCTSPEAKRDALAARDITYASSLQLLENLSEADAMKQVFEQINRTFYEGETLDLLLREDGSLRSQIDDPVVEAAIPASTEGVYNESRHLSLEERLHERVAKINAAMFASFGDMVRAYGADPTTADALKRYGHHYGMSLQIVNDMQDYSLTEAGGTREKRADDAFKDLREGRFGWPSYAALAAGIELPREYSDEELDNFRERLCKEGAMKQVAREAGAHALIANEALKEFPKSEPRSMLMDAAYSMGFLSKYVQSLEKQYDVQLRPSKSEARTRADEIMSSYT